MNHVWHKLGERMARTSLRTRAVSEKIAMVPDRSKRMRGFTQISHTRIDGIVTRKSARNFHGEGK